MLDSILMTNFNTGTDADWDHPTSPDSSKELEDKVNEIFNNIDDDRHAQLMKWDGMLYNPKEEILALIALAVQEAKIDMVNELFKGWTDTADGEHWKYMTKKHRDQIITTLTKENPNDI